MPSTSSEAANTTAVKADEHRNCEASLIKELGATSEQVENCDSKLDEQTIESSQVVAQKELAQPRSEMTKRSAKQHKKWNRRLKIFFCCLGYKKNKVSKNSLNCLALLLAFSVS